MSYSEQFAGPSPYPPGSPEDIEYTRSGNHQALSLLSLIPGALAQLLPAARNDQGEARAEIPGLLTSVYGGLGAGVPAVANWVGGKLGYNPEIPPAPGSLDALRRYEDTSRLAKDLIPTEKLAENPQEAGLHDAMFSGGGMIVPIPGKAVTNLASMVPTAAGKTAAKVAGHVAVPTLEGAPVGVPAMAGVSALASGGQPEVDEFGVPIAQAGQQPPAADASGGATTLPFKSNSTQGTTGQEVDEFGVPTSQVAPPTYSAQGTSGWSYPQTIVAYATAGAGAWLVLKHGGKLLNPLVDAFQGVDRDVTKFNANLDRIDRSGTALPKTELSGGPPRGEAPIEATRFGTRTAQNWWDSNRIVNKFTEEVAPTKTAAQQMEATTGTTKGSSAMSRRIAEQMRTGVPTVGQPGVSLFDVVKKVDGLSAGEHQVLDYGLQARSELDTRLMKFNEAMKSGVEGQLDDRLLRHNFYNEDSATLRAARDLMMNNPRTAEIADLVKRMHLEHIDNMELRGRITSQVARDVRNQRPNYISSVDRDGRISQTFGERDIETWGGQQDMPTRVIDAIVQHYGAIYSDMAHNEWLRNIVLTAVRQQEADPARARVFTEKLGPQGEYMPTGGKKLERTVTFHTADGPRTFYTDNTVLHRALVSNNSQIGLLWNTANAMRNLQQRGTTGVSSALFGGNPFAPKSFFRNVAQIATDRSPGTYGGLIDRTLQRRGLPGYRGWDPTSYVGSGIEVARSAAAHTAKNFSDLLMTRASPVSMALRATKGDQWVDALATRMNHRYEQSLAAEMASKGAGGGGSFGLNQPPTFQMTGAAKGVVNPLANASPGLFHQAATDRVTLPFTNIRLPGVNGVVAQYINLRSMLRDIHSSIQEGGNAYYYRLNKDNPKLTGNQLAYETNRILGDPSMGGAHSLAQIAGANVPFLHPMVQDTVRFARNFRDNPLTFSLGTVQRLGVMAVASTLTAMLWGKGHVDHLENQITTESRASNGIFYHSPDVNNHTIIALPQRDAWLYPLILEAVATGIGAFQAHEGEDTWNRIIHSLADFFSHHVQNSTHTSQAHGLGTQLDVAVPPAFSVPLGIFGAEMRNPVKEMITNKMEGDPLTSGVVRNFDTPSKRPGSREGDTLVSHDDGKWMQHFLSNTLGALGDAYKTFYVNPSTRIAEGASPTEALFGIISDAGQTYRDRAPWGNFVWGNNVKVSTFNPMEERNANRLNKMKALKGPSEIESQGFASPGSQQPVVVTGKPTMPTDPAMLNMYMLAHQTYQTMQPMLKQANDTKVAMDAINSSGYSAQQKRSLGNHLSAKYNDQLALVDAQFNSLDAAMSQIAGGRHVEIGQSINWQGTVEQFHF